MKSNKAIRTDKIPVEFFKDIPDHIIDIFTNIFNTHLKQKSIVK
jgi:hypothetical protein